MHTLDLRTLPGARETIAYQDGGLFPVMVSMPASATPTSPAEPYLTAVLRGGAGHLGRAGRLDMIRSFDGGLTWSPPAVAVNSDWDDRNPALGVSPAGTLILAYECDHHYLENGAYDFDPGPGEWRIDLHITRSADGGLTWQPPQALGDSPFFHTSSFGRIITLPDGTLLLPLYGLPPGEVRHPSSGPQLTSSFILRSRDDGLSWDDPTCLAQGFNETALEYLSEGDLMAVMRSEGEGRLASTRSADGGRTWSEPLPLTDPGQHPADLLRLPGGRVLLVYGNRRSEGQRIEGRLSSDGGRTWEERLLILSSRLSGYAQKSPFTAEMGYPSTAISAGRLAVLYYIHPAFPDTSNWRDPAFSAYHPTGYRAVCLSLPAAALA